MTLRDLYKMNHWPRTRLGRTPAVGGDDGTNDLLVGDVIRTNEMQGWFLAEHLAV